MARKIMWLGVAPWAPTGYGDQARVFMPRIRDLGYEMAMSCHHGLEYVESSFQGMRMFPKDYTGQNKLVLKEHVEAFGQGEPVKVLSLFDLWPWVHPGFGGVVADFKGLDIAAWAPIDCMPVPPGTSKAIEEFDVRPIAMSRFGEEQLKNAGFDPLYVPHGIETDVLKPADDRSEARRFVGFPDDAFVVGMVAHNAGRDPSRKAFPEALQAFAWFQKEHDDAILYLHTDVTGKMDPSGGLDLIELATYLGIPESKIRVVPYLWYMQAKIHKPAMSLIYSSLDVLLNASMGEGFGIPIVEAQACGTPVIVSAWTSMPELCGAGWQVGGQPWLNTKSGGRWLQPSVDEIIQALQRAYAHRGDRKLRDQAREFALQYDADTITEQYWKPVLEELHRPREVPPLPFAPKRGTKRPQDHLKKAAA